jgi:hypothetical protein
VGECVQLWLMGASYNVSKQDGTVPTRVPHGMQRLGRSGVRGPIEGLTSSPNTQIIEGRATRKPLRAFSKSRDSVRRHCVAVKALQVDSASIRSTGNILAHAHRGWWRSSYHLVLKCLWAMAGGRPPIKVDQSFLGFLRKKNRSWLVSSLLRKAKSVINNKHPSAIHRPDISRRDPHLCKKVRGSELWLTTPSRHLKSFLYS